MTAKELLLCAALVLASAPAASQMPNADGVLLGGAFALTDQHGRVVTDQTFADRFMLLYFGYTFCPDVCPPSLQTMSEVMEALGPESERVQPLFVTVDPARDTPAHIREYLEHFYPAIIGLTGPAPMVAAMAKKYRIKAEKHATNPNDLSYLMDHTSSLILMGPGGGFVDRFGYGMPAEDITDRVRSHLAAARR